jgi:hypothetical protein
MQQTSATDKGMQISRIALAFSMFPMVIDPLKYCWVMILPGIAMIYFSFRKYKEEKKAGLEHSKFGLISIIQLIAIIVIIAASVSNYLISIGYYD